MAKYTLYYTPGACSLSPHIALREAGIPFDLARVDLRTKKLADGGDWLAINPKGYVPAVTTPDGEVLTEGAIIVQYLADAHPEAKLAPPLGTRERRQINEWLHFIATELHKGMSPLYTPVANEEYKAALRERLAGRFAVLAAAVKDRPFLAGDRFTIADGYAFYVMRSWVHAVKQDLTRWPELVAYYDRLAKRPAVAAALEAEGLKP